MSHILLSIFYFRKFLLCIYVFLFLFYFLAIPLASSKVSSIPTEIFHPEVSGEFKQDDHYFLGLLKLALENSKEHLGPYKLISSTLPMLQQRAIAEVIDGELDVIWTMTSPEREEVLMPIRIPTLRGLGGFRIFLIRRDEQNLFTTISNEEMLRSFIAGQGLYWPDSNILLDNGYNLIQAPDHAALIKMLIYKRFDYMPRSLHEIWAEVARFHELKVEETLAFYYPSPFYFFVNNKNKALHHRISLGLKNAMENGSFKRYFDNNASTKNLILNAKLYSRKIFELENNFMTPETKAVMSDTKFIYQP